MAFGAFGAFVGITGSQLLPVADTLVEAAVEAGLGPRTAQAIVLGLFATGGAEGALILHPLLRQRAGRQDSA